MLRKDLNNFNNIFEQFNKGWALLTAGGKDFNAMTVSWGQIGVLWNKNVVTVYVRQTRYTYEFIQKYENFSLSFLGEEYKPQLTIFGRKSGRNTNKFKETGLTPIYDVDFDVTYIKEAKYVLKMKKIYVGKIESDNFIDSSIEHHYPDKDYHFVYIGEIKQFLENDEI